MNIGDYDRPQGYLSTCISWDGIGLFLRGATKSPGSGNVISERLGEISTSWNGQSMFFAQFLRALFNSNSVETGTETCHFWWENPWNQPRKNIVSGFFPCYLYDIYIRIYIHNIWYDINYTHNLCHIAYQITLLLHSIYRYQICIRLCTMY